MDVIRVHREVDAALHDFIDGNLMGFRDIKLGGNIFARQHPYAKYSSVTLEAQGRIDSYTLGEIRDLQASIVHILADLLDDEWSVQLKTRDVYNRARRVKIPSTQITLRHSKALT